LLTEHNDAKLVIVGDGKMRNKLLAQARQTGLRIYSAWHDSFSNNYDIFFLGEHPNPFPFLKRSTLFLLPSLYEGFPNVLIEAMFSGLPVIAADCNYGPREILIDESGNKYGELLPIDPDTTGLAEVWINEILRNLIDPRTNYGLVQERAQEFARERILKLWIDLIECEMTI